MPRISAFYGIVITMYFSDHPPPHFHAKYGDHLAEIAIDALELIDGWLRRVPSDWSWSGPASTRSSCARTGTALAPTRRWSVSILCPSI